MRCGSEGGYGRGYFSLLNSSGTGVPMVPYSTISGFSGNCSVFSAFPFPFVCMCVPPGVVVMKGGRKEGRAQYVFHDSLKASPELK